MHITNEWIDKLSWTMRGLHSLPPHWGNTASSQLSSTFASCHRNCVKHTTPMAWPAALNNCLKFTCANFNNCGVNFELPLALAIHIFAGLILLFWHTATEKRILSTKEPIIYHETCGDRTRYLKTETTLPVVSCPAGLFQATEIVSKNTIQWHGRGGTWPTEASWNRLHKSIFFRSNNN